jgi:PPOX class probable F420-dependent enzyme
LNWARRARVLRPISQLARVGHGYHLRVTIEMDERVRTLLDGQCHAVMASVNGDGSPHTSPVWVVRDGDVLLFAVHANDGEASNLEREPRTSVTLLDVRDPSTTVDIQGVVEFIEDPEDSLKARFAQKYSDLETLPRSPDAQRLIGRLVPESVSD